jgi:hypothetical protein
MTAINTTYSQTLLSLVAALLIGFTFIGAATAPALVTATANSVIVA